MQLRSKSVPPTIFIVKSAQMHKKKRPKSDSSIKSGKITQPNRDRYLKVEHFFNCFPIWKEYRIQWLLNTISLIFRYFDRLLSKQLRSNSVVLNDENHSNKRLKRSEQSSEIIIAGKKRFIKNEQPAVTMSVNVSPSKNIIKRRDIVGDEVESTINGRW